MLMPPLWGIYWRQMSHCHHLLALLCHRFLPHILNEIRGSSRSALKHAAIFLQEHHFALANYSFATVFGAPKFAGLRHLKCIVGEGQRYGSHKNRLFEANHLAAAGYQSEAMMWRNCHMHGHAWIMLEAALARFSSFCPCTSFKTVFWALNYEIKNYLTYLQNFLFLRGVSALFKIFTFFFL